MTSPFRRSTELDRALDRAAGRQEVVDDQHLLARLDRVAMDLERVRAVFERVLDGDRLGRQLAELPDRDQAGVELVGHRGTEDEPARLHPDDDVDLLVLVRLEHQIDRLLVGAGILEQGRDVVEEDAGLREVGDLADPFAQRLGGHRDGVLQQVVFGSADEVLGGCRAGRKVYRSKRGRPTCADRPMIDRRWVWRANRLGGQAPRATATVPTGSSVATACSRPLRTTPRKATPTATAKPTARPPAGFPVERTEAATSAPVIPVPSAVPSESVSEIADDARPCSAVGASRSTMSASGEYARPIA